MPIASGSPATVSDTVETKAAPKEGVGEEPGKILVRAPLRGEVTRRGLFSVIGLGWVKFKVGYPAEFSVDAVDERFKATRGCWIVREASGFYCLSTTCTHLGCTPNW